MDCIVAATMSQVGVVQPAINLIVSVESLYSRYFTFMSAISLVSLAILEDVVISASGKDNQGTYEQNRSGDM